jgi:PPM family protein phosphatase
MPTLETLTRVQGHGAVCEDSVALFKSEGWVVAVVADGAGGTSGGQAASQAVVALVADAIEAGRAPGRAEVWYQVLTEAGTKLTDFEIGQSTAVVVATNGTGIVGASVGDSEAWLIRSDSLIDLTKHQERKPLLGGGAVEPTAFAESLWPGDVLLLATDGIVKYAPAERLAALARRRLPVSACSDAMVELVRLPDGGLQDDLGLVLIRSSRLELEAAMAQATRRWYDALQVDHLPDERALADKGFADALEKWVATLPPDDRFRGRWHDGLVVESYGFDSPTQISAQGRIWETSKQRRYRYEVQLEFSGDLLARYEVLFGDASTPDGSSPDQGRKSLELVPTREWLYQLKSE